MAIKAFSDEEKAAAKAKATADFQGACMVVHLDAPINESLILAPFDRKAYSAYSDAEDRDPQVAYSTALMDRRIFPDLAALDAINKRWPALAEQAARALDDEAGARMGASFDPLDLAALPDGLSLAEAQRLVGDAKGANLWTVKIKAAEVALVMMTPDPHTWIAARATYDDARRKGRGSIDAADPYVQAAVVWSSTPIAQILDARPALFFPLWTLYKRAGGEGAAARTFRL